MKLLIVRHGETIENAADIVMGQNGGTLSETGIEQAKATAKQLQHETFDQLWSSDLKRCVDTAKYILEYHPDLKLQTTAELREVNYGEFQGRPGAEIRAFFEARGGFTPDSKAAGGESHREMSDRVLKFVNFIFNRFPDQRILLVSHNGPIEAIRAAAERTPFTEDAKNASVREVELSRPLELYEA